jgi:nitroreductase
LDLIEAIRTRRSIRRFKQTSIPDSLIHSLIDSARHAPSGHNTQPWEFIIVKEKRVKVQLAKTHEWSDFVDDAPVCIVVLANEEKAPSYFEIDAACATQNLLLAAHGLGLGACWVAVYDLQNPNFEKHVKSVLNVPPHMRVIAMVPIGYPDEKAAPLSRREINEIIHLDTY